MRTARNLSFLFFVCTAIVFFNTSVSASVVCTNLPETTCSPGDKYGKTCTMASEENECPRLGETCSQYCDDGVDGGAGSCTIAPNGSSYGQCWCSGWQQCPSCGRSGESCTINAQCCTGLVCNQIMGQCSTNESPILINLVSRAGEDHLTSAVDGVLFDINADGVIERVAWTEPDAPVAFLALDRNQNGYIDDGAELFGNNTPKRDGTLAANGFEALIDLDGGFGQSDGQIDARDAVYSRLRVWLDSNHNGVSEASELSPLQVAGVTRLFTGYRESRRIDQYGNEYRYVGLAMLRRNGREVFRRIFDVFLVVAP